MSYVAQKDVRFRQYLRRTTAIEGSIREEMIRLIIKMGGGLTPPPGAELTDDEVEVYLGLADESRAYVDEKDRFLNLQFVGRQLVTLYPEPVTSKTERQWIEIGFHGDGKWQPASTHKKTFDSLRDILTLLPYEGRIALKFSTAEPEWEYRHGADGDGLFAFTFEELASVLENEDFAVAILSYRSSLERSFCATFKNRTPGSKIAEAYMDTFGFILSEEVIERWDREPWGRDDSE